MSTAKWCKGGWIWFPENVFVYGYSNYVVKFKFIFYPYKKPKWANSWHQERRVIKLSVKYKLPLAGFILWPKFTLQYFLSALAYLPILDHSTRVTPKSAVAYAWLHLRAKQGEQKPSFSNKQRNSLRNNLWLKYKNTRLISDLTTRNGNKTLFILRNRVHSFVAENWARCPITGPTNEASIFVITREKTALSSR